MARKQNSSGLQSPTSVVEFSLTGQPPSLQPFTALSSVQKEEVKAAIEFLLSLESVVDGFTCKWVLKNCPEIARDLEDGILALDDLRDAFSDELDSTVPTGTLETEMNAVEQDVRHIAIKALHERFGPRGFRPSPVEKEAFARVFDDFTLTLLKTLVKLCETHHRNPRSHMEWMRLYKEATDATCKAKACLLDDVLFQGQQKFLQKCPVLNQKPRFFSVILGDKPRDMESTTDRHYQRLCRDMTMIAVGRVFEQVASGLYRAHRSCLRCDTTFKASARKECSDCHVAVYCGRQCQRKHWKEVHKTHCANLSTAYSIFEESLCIVSAAHDAAIEKRVSPSFCVDYSALQHCTSGTEVSPWEGTAFEETFKEASIQNYFENLRRIETGSLWFFSVNESLDEYKKRLHIDSVDEALIAELCLRDRLIPFLCYDYEEYRRGLGISQSEFHQRIFFNCALLLKVVDKEKLRMPASRFLELYDFSRPKFTNKAAMVATSQKMEDDALKEFTKSYQK